MDVNCLINDRMQSGQKGGGRPFSPVVHGRPPACAVVDADGEDGEEEEEAGHAEAHLVDGRVAHQSLAVLL